MLIEVHRVVQESDDLERTRAAHSIEHDMARIPARLFDVIAQDSRPCASHSAELRFGGDSVQGFADEVTILPSLFLAVAVSRVLEDIDDVGSRKWRADYACHQSGALGVEP
jgi:hypothetical protein